MKASKKGDMILWGIMRKGNLAMIGLPREKYKDTMDIFGGSFLSASIILVHQCRANSERYHASIRLTTNREGHSN